MPVLVIDTAMESSLVGVAVEGRAVRQRWARDSRASARSILRLVAEILEDAGLTRGELTSVVLGTGPGSFTGLRIGMASGIGLAFGLGIPVCGVSSLTALRRGEDGVVAVIDARRGEVFAEGPGLGPVAMAPGELAESLPRDAVVIGDGAIRYRDVFETRGLVLPDDDDLRHLGETASYVRLARFDGAPLQANYVRGADATIPVPKRERAAL